MKPPLSLALSLCVSLAAGLAAHALQSWWTVGHDAGGHSSVADLLGGDAAGGGWSAADRPRSFRFPEDHGPHEEFRNEWWYFTGNLEGLGYELTLFRQGLESPQEALQPRRSAWAARDAYLAHFALSDLEHGRFRHFEKLSRGAVGLAGSSSQRVWVEDWSIQRTGLNDFRLHARADDVTLDLDLHSRKPPTLQGERGWSRKGSQPDQSSYYYSLTRLASRGRLQQGSISRPVTGWSWMDREWSTRPLAPDLVGWDWFALQMSGDRELMFYQLRRRDGSVSPQSSGTWVEPDGSSRHLSASEVDMRVTEWWTSPRDGTRYPAGWQLKSAGHVWTVRPALADQELTGLVRYWEGAVTLEEDGRPAGRGYVEMVGYAKESR